MPRPIGTMSIAVGESYAGAVMGDISTRRGRIIGTDSNDAGETVIMVRVPYAEVVSYTKDLRSISARDRAAHHLGSMAMSKLRPMCKKARR